MNWNMRNKLGILGLALLFMMSCSDSANGEGDNGGNGGDLPSVTEPGSFFPDENDGSRMLSGNDAEKLSELMPIADPKYFLSLKAMEITEKEFNEMKAFTDDLVTGLNSEKEIFETLYNWVNKNLQYGEVERQRPYAAWKNRKGNCQGYSNTLRVFCISQGIPCVGINGWLYADGGMGHAWTYAYVGGEWGVYDALNGFEYSVGKPDTYAGMLLPYSVDMPLFEDDGFKYGFNKGLVVQAVKKIDSVVTVPNFYAGVRITGVVLEEDVPETVKDLYLSSSISDFGGNENPTLKQHASMLRGLFIPEKNRTWETEDGILYERNFNSAIPYFIPGGIEVIRLRPMTTVAKNVIYGCPHVKEIYFDASTRMIEAWAVENCPELKTVYVPASCEIADQAFPEGVVVKTL